MAVERGAAEEVPLSPADRNCWLEVAAGAEANADKVLVQIHGRRFGASLPSSDSGPLLLSANVSAERDPKVLKCHICVK